jgi:hypothetical protein
MMMPQIVVSARSKDWTKGVARERERPRIPIFAASMSTM